MPLSQLWKFRGKLIFHQIQETLKSVGLFLITFLITTHSTAQDLEDSEIVESKIKLTVEQLMKEGVDSIFIYKSNGIGFDRSVPVPKGASDKVIDSLFCEIKEAGYVFAVSKGKMIAHKLHPCFSFQTITVTNSKIMTILKDNPDMSKVPDIKPFQFRDRKGEIYTTYIDHREVRTVIVKLPTADKEIFIDMYNLSQEQDAKRNINYNINLTNPAYLLSQTFEEQLETLNFKRVERKYNNGN